MLMDRNISLKKIKLFFLLALCLILFFLTPSVKIHLLIYWVAVLYSCFLVKFDITHPYCWFPITFALYNTAYTILYALGYDISAGYSVLNSIYSFIGMGIVLLTISPDKKEKVEEDFKQRINYKANKIFFIVTALLSIVFAVILRSRGYAGKAEMQDSGDTLYLIGVHLVRWMMAMMLIITCSYKCQDNKKNIFYFGISFIAALFMGLCTGERDIIFRAFLLIIMPLFYFKKLKKRHLLYVIPIIIIGMIASVYFKYYFLRGVGNTSHMETGSIVYQFLSSDFQATGRNTQYLLNTAWTKSYFGIKLFFNELFRGIIPGFDYINPSKWYNYSVFPGGFKGQAFTMVGFGYVISGLYGIIGVFALIGLLIGYIYKKHNKNLYYLVFYLFFITIIAGCYRQTINSIINISIKDVLLVIAFSSLFARKKR